MGRLLGSRITETFGKYQHSPFDGKHYGIDFALTIGTPIKAPTNGKVTRIFNNELGGKVLQIAEQWRISPVVSTLTNIMSK